MRSSGDTRSGWRLRHRLPDADGRARIGPIKNTTCRRNYPIPNILSMLLHFQSTMVANGRRTRPQIFISPQSICNDPPATPPICGCFRRVWKLPEGRRCVVDAAVDAEPLHSPTRGIDGRDCVRAIERRRLRHVGWPGLSANGAVDSRTDGCEEYANDLKEIIKKRRVWLH